MKKALAYLLPIVMAMAVATPGLAQEGDPGNQPPSVALLSPPNGAFIPGPAHILVSAAATDSDGFVVSTEFFANGESLGLGYGITTPFFSYFYLLWPDVQEGEYEIVAVAMDDDGATTESAPFDITVFEDPYPAVVQIKATDPEGAEPGPLATVLDTATFTIGRSGPTDDPLDVHYRVGGTAQNGADYAEIENVVTIPAGRHRVDVVIEPIDDNLVEGDESVVIVLVPVFCPAVFPPPADCYEVGRHDRARAVIHDNDHPNQPPKIRLVHPMDGELFRAPADVRLVAKAFDLDGNIVKVEFFAGHHSLGVVTDTCGPSVPSLDVDDVANGPFYCLDWSNVPVGHYLLRAVATDDYGDEAISRPVEIKVVEIQPPSVVRIEATDPEASEPDPTGTWLNTAAFTVKRTGPTGWPLTVYYRIGGTAENGVDYEKITHRVQIPAGSSSAKIVIRPIDDLLFEGPESVALRLVPWRCNTDFPSTDHACYRIGDPGHARAVILDNDRPPLNEPPRVKIVQPTDGSRFRAPADIPIKALAHDADGDVVQVEFFANGQSIGVVTRDGGIGTVNVAEISENTNPAAFTDLLHFADIFRLWWQNVGPGAYDLTAVATDDDGDSTTSAPVSIRVIHRPHLPVVNIYAIDRIGFESLPKGTGNAPDPAVFVVVRDSQIGQDLPVHYRIGGTADNGVDYLALSGMVTIPQGSHYEFIVVRPIDDTEHEPFPETVDLAIAERPCVTDANASTLTGCYRKGHHAIDWAVIVDDDSVPNIPPRVAIAEPADGELIKGPADIRIAARAHDPDGGVRKVEFFANGVSIGVSNGHPPGSLTPIHADILAIDPNFDASSVMPVPIVPVLDSPFQILWADVQPGQYELTAVATDNDGDSTTSNPANIRVFPFPNVVSIITTDDTATEPNPWEDADFVDTAEFEVSRTGPTHFPLTVNYSVGGTASNGQDYELLVGQVVIPTGRASAPIPVIPLHDLEVEGTESVVVDLRPPVCIEIWPPPVDCYRIGSPSGASAQILDNDQPNVLPNIQITTPASLSEFNAGDSIPISATAVDPDGWIQTVEFFANFEKIGEVSVYFIVAPPPGQPQVFDMVWENVPEGQYLLWAKATDQLGGMGSSPVVAIFVNQVQIPIVNIFTIDPLAREEPTPFGINTARFRVFRYGAPINQPLNVFYDTRGRATNGVDYDQLSGMVTIPPGRSSAPIDIVPIDDNLPEGRESVIARLYVPTDGLPQFQPYEIGRFGRAGAVIVDRDYPGPFCHRLPDGIIHICVGANNGDIFRVEATEDMGEWVPIQTLTVTDDALHYVDPEAEDYPTRIYRFVPVESDSLRNEE